MKLNFKSHTVSESKQEIFKTTLKYENIHSDLILITFVFVISYCKCFKGNNNRMFTYLPILQANAVIYKAPEIRSEDQGS
jgi:hypothetical protein